MAEPFNCNDSFFVSIKVSFIYQQILDKFHLHSCERDIDLHLYLNLFDFHQIIIFRKHSLILRF